MLTPWHDSLMLARPNTKRTFRFISLLGLLFLEVSLVVGFYVVPEFHARKYAPDGHWEMETPLHAGPGMWVALITFLGLFAMGNIGLIILVWRAFKDLVWGWSR
jgi:hypothetical protein